MKNKGRPIPITLILHRASKWLIRLKTAIIQALTLSDDDARDAHEPNITLLLICRPTWVAYLEVPQSKVARVVLLG